MSHLKNVLRLVGCCLEFEQPVMVYEYVEGISVSYLLFRKGNHDDDQTRKLLLSWGNRLQIANEVASAIVFLHTEFTTPIIFKDLNPSNVIIDQNSGVGKILDFSLSISLPPGKLEVVKDIISRNGCLAPEYAISGIVTQKADVYSFGVVLLQLLTGEKMSTLNIEDPEYI
uniref:Serine-threonine protein kinase, plant-type n=1 Tax=Solanum tuberosum TaxID=4113 RepID=M1C8E8_SOLTU